MICLTFLFSVAHAETPTPAESLEPTTVVVEDIVDDEPVTFTPMEWEQARCDAMLALSIVREELAGVKRQLSMSAPKLPPGEALRFSDSLARADLLQADSERYTTLLAEEGMQTLAITLAEAEFIKLTGGRIPSSHTLSWCSAQTWEDTE